MSQQTVLELLQELGGTASSSEIIRLARQKYADRSLWQYVGDRLRKLKRWGFVDYDAITRKYFIVVEQQPEAEDLVKFSVYMMDELVQMTTVIDVSCVF